MTESGLKRCLSPLFSIIEGTSLEPPLLERIRINISRFPQMADEDLNKVYTWWNDLNNDFVRLNQNYQDYIRDLNSVKAEKMRLDRLAGYQEKILRVYGKETA